MNKLVEYAINDAGSLTIYRPINAEVIEKIFVYVWEGKEIDF
jgi:hypothetical protein